MPTNTANPAQTARRKRFALVAVTVAVFNIAFAGISLREGAADAPAADAPAADAAAAIQPMIAAVPPTAEHEAARTPRVTQAISDTRFVIHISVDGLGSAWYQPVLASGVLTHFKRLQDQGAWTHNARTDFDFTITLPNHTGMLTGRPVLDKNGETGSGHHWTTNTTPAAGVTLHNTAGYYIASAFDVAHDSGFSTSLYASKEKFILYDTSYDVGHGAPDTTGVDFGPDKIDAYSSYDLDSTRMMSDFLRAMTDTPTQYTFVHFNDADTAGHAKGWGSAEYNDAVASVDAKLGKILALIDASAAMRDHTWIVLSADHGGGGLTHVDITLPTNFTIPVILWGPGIAANSDLYAINGRAATDPGASRPDSASKIGQPIRNTDTGNCALQLLGLPTIPGSRSNGLRQACGGPSRVYLPLLLAADRQ